MPEPAVLVEQRDALLLVTLNRPHALNAVDAELAEGLGAALERLDADPDLRVGVVTGAGERAFCAGADLKELSAGRRPVVAAHPEWGFAGAARHHVRTPLVAAVNGLAYGGGLEIVLACDLAVAADTARFALPEVSRGILAAGGGLVRLGRQVPPRIALEMALTGEPVDAQTALQHGLVNRVVPRARVLDEALALAGAVARGAPLAVQASKRVLHAVGVDGQDAEPGGEAALWALSDAAAREVWQSADAQEGPRAFAEGRPPVWQGR